MSSFDGQAQHVTAANGTKLTTARKIGIDNLCKVDGRCTQAIPGEGSNAIEVGLSIPRVT